MKPSKVWFITGASRGFGRLWSLAALGRGDRVVATARNTDSLRELEDRFGDAVLALPVDVTNRQSIDHAVDQAIAKFGRIDVLISNAGYGLMGCVEEVRFDDARDLFETNVLGTLSVIQAVLPQMRKQGAGHILPVSSIAGLISLPGAAIYNSTKFAVEGLGEALAAEVKAFGIHVTIIEPGGYATDFLKETSLRRAMPMDAYQPIHAELATFITPEQLGDPKATSPALMQVVDSLNPPNRLMLGALLPMIRDRYVARVDEWIEWEDVSLAAHSTAAQCAGLMNKD